MQKVRSQDNIPRRSYRPEQQFCPKCQNILKRSHILWRKYIIMLDGPVRVTSWGYRCFNTDCPTKETLYRSAEAEGLHLTNKQFGRDVIVHVGYRRFWYHQTMYELHEWLTQDLELAVSESQVFYLIIDFLALLGAAQPTKVRDQLKTLKRLIIGLDGMQPEKGNTCLYIVRELQLDLTLLAENLDDSSAPTIRVQLLQPLKALAKEMNLPLYGIVSDAQQSIRTAASQELPDIPHQACQSHCLCKAGELTFENDRNLKKRLKATFRQRLRRLEQRIERLPKTDPYRPVLADYANAMHSTLLEGGVAPFDLGGVQVFADLTALAASLARCREKGGTCCCIASPRSPTAVCLLRIKWLDCSNNDNGSSTWSICWIRPTHLLTPLAPVKTLPRLLTTPWLSCSPKSDRTPMKKIGKLQLILTRPFAAAGGGCLLAMMSKTCHAPIMIWKGTCDGSRQATAASLVTRTSMTLSSVMGVTLPMSTTEKARMTYSLACAKSVKMTSFVSSRRWTLCFYESVSALVSNTTKLTTCMNLKSVGGLPSKKLN